MHISARREFWLWIIAFSLLVGTALVLAALLIGRGGWWLAVPFVWLAAGIAAAEWLRKRRHSATLTWWATTDTGRSGPN